MKTACVAATILLSLILSAPRASAQAEPTPRMRAYHCISISANPATSHVTAYISQMIPLEANAQLALNGAWAAYIRMNYHVETTSSITCQGLSTNPAIQEQTLAAEENVWKQQGWEIVHVTWKPGLTGSSASASSMYSAAPGPAGVAPTAAAGTPAPSQGDQPSASYCFSDVRRPTIYFSEAFDTAGMPSSAPYSTAFTKFLAQKYKYTGTVTCKTTNTIYNAQSMYREQKEGLQGKQIIETDWTYSAP